MFLAFVLSGTKIFVGFVLQSLRKSMLTDKSDNYMKLHLFSLHPTVETLGLTFKFVRVELWIKFCKSRSLV